MPGGPGTTDHTDGVVQLWTGSWIAALLVGVLVWGLLIWCVVAYRKRKDDHQLPVQLRYHLPLELLYTFVPVLMVGVLFFYTVRTQDAITSIDEDATDVSIQVYGRQWSWDFNYLDYDVWDTGQPADLNNISTGQAGLDEYAAQDEVPTLYLPVGQTVTFTLNSRDVIHSFWIPEFYFKMDVIPGRINQFDVTPTRMGTFTGRCAELCGLYHSRMIFKVHVVSRAEYDKHMAELKAIGQVGELAGAKQADKIAGLENGDEH